MKSKIANQKSKTHKPVVVLIGRQNVGKSSLFNRLSQSRRAIMSPEPGTTRDWIQGDIFWGEHTYSLIDTGGYEPSEEEVLSAVRQQVEQWVKTADLVLWVVDGKEGLTAVDQSLCQRIRRLSDNVVVVANKIDDHQQGDLLPDFYRLGFNQVIPVSAAHGKNINDLLDVIESSVSLRARTHTDAEEEACPKVAVLGRPNVGKSSLLNCLLKEKRMIISSEPGTTRDAIDTLVQFNQKKFLFVDTAGLRSKKSKVSGLEGLTRIMSEKALDKCEVAVLMLNAVEGLVDGDTAIGRLIESRKKACVVAVNKWDIVQDRSIVSQWFRQHQPDEMPFLAYCPLVFSSAKTGHKVQDLMDQVWQVRQSYDKNFDAEDLTSFFWTQIQERPYSYKGKKLKFNGAQQTGHAPPVFLLKTNMTDDHVHFSYKRRLENLLRERYQLKGVPIILKFRKMK